MPIVRSSTLSAIAEPFRLVIDVSPNAMVLTDESGTILLVNTHAEHLFQCEAGALIGLPFEQLIPPRQRENHQSYREALVLGSPERALGQGREVYGLRADGSEFPIDMALWPLASAGRKLVLAAITDATERKRSEERLTHSAAQLAEAKAELERFTYMLSHDLREPVRTVRSFAELLRRDLGTELRPQAAQYLLHLVEGTQRMREMIDGLLEYGRVQSLPLIEVDCAQVVARAWRELEPSAREACAEYVVGELPVVRGQPDQLGRLFQCLFENAIKFRREVPLRIEIKAERAGSFWRISVADNGIGFDMRFADRIFQIFQRLHTREEYAGTGLGLALCKRIVDHHGGQLGVDSTPGEGSSFWCTLPCL